LHSGAFFTGISALENYFRFVVIAFPAAVGRLPAYEVGSMDAFYMGFGKAARD
jgi:hypothetical protein